MVTREIAYPRMQILCMLAYPHQSSTAATLLHSTSLHDLMILIYFYKIYFVLVLFVLVL